MSDYLPVPYIPQTPTLRELKVERIPYGENLPVPVDNLPVPFDPNYRPVPYTDIRDYRVPPLELPPGPPLKGEASPTVTDFLRGTTQFTDLSQGYAGTRFIDTSSVRARMFTKAEETLYTDLRNTPKIRQRTENDITFEPTIRGRTIFRHLERHADMIMQPLLNGIVRESMKTAILPMVVMHIPQRDADSRGGGPYQPYARRGPRGGKRQKGRYARGRGPDGRVTRSLRDTVRVIVNADDVTHVAAVELIVGDAERYYAPALMWGTRNRGGNPRHTTHFPGTPFLQRGIREGYPAFQTLLSKGIEESFIQCCDESAKVAKSIEVEEEEEDSISPLRYLLTYFGTNLVLGGAPHIWRILQRSPMLRQRATRKYHREVFRRQLGIVRIRDVFKGRAEMPKGMFFRDVQRRNKMFLDNLRRASDDPLWAQFETFEETSLLSKPLYGKVYDAKAVPTSSLIRPPSGRGRSTTGLSLGSNNRLALGPGS